MDTSDTGIIFDLQRCSMYDGPGIRTTVFFKGCPVHCKWCHNPESQYRAPQLAFHKASCTLCGACSLLCPQVHTIRSGLHDLHLSACNACGKCAAVCPSQALKIIGKSVTAEEIMETVRKDQKYYEQTGGGLTVSGGEPFMQYGFLKSLLQKAKSENIPTCVETCGYTPQKQLADVAPYIDLFLYDCKETSPERHQAFTGIDNILIAKNLDFLYQHHHKIILRCPIIPGYNDTEEHFAGIALMEQKYPLLTGIEIMPYHSLGREKAASIGNVYEIKASTADDSTKALWKEQLKSAGCSRTVLESF